jgi:hypothetical protein
VVTFHERPAGEPEALRAWFYPGKNWGDEFVYPKAKAVALAQANNTIVLATPAELPVEVEKPILTVNEPVVAQLQQAPVVAIKPTGETVDVAQAVTPPPTQATEVAQAAPATLPSTASSLPLIALFGLLALGGAWTLKSVHRRVL